MKTWATPFRTIKTPKSRIFSQFEYPIFIGTLYIITSITKQKYCLRISQKLFQTLKPKYLKEDISFLIITYFKSLKPKHDTHKTITCGKTWEIIEFKIDFILARQFIIRETKALVLKSIP